LNSIISDFSLCNFLCGLRGLLFKELNSLCQKGSATFVSPIPELKEIKGQKFKRRLNRRAQRARRMRNRNFGFTSVCDFLCVLRGLLFKRISSHSGSNGSPRRAKWWASAADGELGLLYYWFHLKKVGDKIRMHRPARGSLRRIVGSQLRADHLGEGCRRISRCQ
jgi:hypothetical protein